MTSLKQAVRRFRLRETGSVVAEAVLILPAMIWFYIALFVYWDCYRTVNTLQKSAYTVSDIISRQQVDISDQFMNGMQKTMDFLVDRRETVKIRVTSLRYLDTDAKYEVIWSRSPGSKMPRLTTADLVLIKDHLPNMSDGDSAVLLEAEVPYAPPLQFGMEPRTIEQFVVTRSRFLPKICYVGVACG